MRTSITVCLVLTVFLCIDCTIPGKRIKSMSNKRINHNGLSQENFDFTGCPLENDFWTTGVISSPYYPSSYPNNIKCWYYMYADIGSVLQFNFTSFDLDGELDYITIYDGNGEIFPIMYVAFVKFLIKNMFNE